LMPRVSHQQQADEAAVSYMSSTRLKVAQQVIHAL
jgi:hypothetical protein